MRYIQKSYFERGRSLYGLGLFLAMFSGVYAQDDNEVSFISGYIGVDGNSAAYVARTNREEGFYTGIERLFWSDELNESTRLFIEGSAIPQWNDYDFRLQFLNDDWGSLALSYREFQTGYQGIGSYLSNQGQIYETSPASLFVDRKWFEVVGTLERAELPTLKIRYARDERNGLKSSTVWAENQKTSARGVVPSIYDLDELRNTIEIIGAKEFEKTTVELSYRYDDIRIENGLLLNQYAGEPTNEKKITEALGSKSEISTVRGFLGYRFNDSIRFTTGASLVELDSESEGRRIYGDAFYAPYDATAGVRQGGDIGFRDLAGRSDMEQLLVHANMALTPSPAVSLILSGRLEKTSKSAVSSFYETQLSADSSIPDRVSFRDGASKDDFDQFTIRWELRYMGFKGLSLFLRATAYYGSGYIEELGEQTRGYVLPSDLPPADAFIEWIDRENDYERKGQKLATGFSWYLRSNLTLSGQYRLEARKNTYEPIDYKRTSFLLWYPNYIHEHNWILNRGFLRLKWIPLTGFSLSTHIDAEVRDQETQSIDRPVVESSQMDSLTIGESLSWTLSPKISLQAFFSYTKFKLKTPAKDLVPVSDGNYFYGSLNAVYLVNKQNQFEIGYSWLDSDDYVDNSGVSVPYGNELSEHIVSIIYRNTISETLKWNLGYRFHSSEDDASNGYNDFDAQEIFLSLSKGF